MSARPNNASLVSVAFYFVVIVALFMAMFELMGWSRETLQPAPIDGIRAGERAKALADLRKSSEDQGAGARADSARHGIGRSGVGGTGNGPSPSDRGIRPPESASPSSRSREAKRV
jgi:hypothetical protein